MPIGPAGRSRASTSSRCAIISTPSDAPAAGTARRLRRRCRRAWWTPPASVISRPTAASPAMSSPSDRVIPGWCAGTRPQMCNCTSGNLEIPGSMRSLSSGRPEAGPVGIAPGNDDRGEINREPAMTDADTVLVERDGPVTIVSINRPHRRNAVDGATGRKLFDAFLAFDADAEASVAVFTGTGGYFCAGADLKAVASGDPDKKREIGGHNSIAPMGPSRLR